MARLDAREDLAGGAFENGGPLLISQCFKLGAGEAGSGQVGVLRDNLELLCDGDCGLLGVTGDHNNPDSSSLAIFD